MNLSRKCCSQSEEGMIAGVEVVVVDVESR